MSKEQEMFALIDEFENSSLNARNFCKTKGVVPSTFYYWKKKKARMESPGSGGFIAISPNIVKDGSLELIYPNGIRLRLEASQFPLISKLLRLY
ncbi:MAG: hypothetical protein RI572_12450 [Salegentibacter sp.]|uniref:IS66 family insertion sequence element accessory protein TnpA n=1 Tax=Salegentibacter sp. TaxID=1903072 RepID=UPI00286FC3AD|nr:hypothetical protein [Salegentibacter sp.]MDR9458208.1 hypothetical protein [Salegentibacter sp.]